MSLKKKISLCHLASEEESKVKDLFIKDLNKVRGGFCNCGGTTCGFYGARDSIPETDGDVVIVIEPGTGTIPDPNPIPIPIPTSGSVVN